MRSIGLTDATGNSYGFPRVTVYGPDGKIKFPTGGGGGGSGTVTSIGITVPSGFNVTPSLITTSGTFAITGAGTTAQYIDGTGALQTFPSIPSFTPSALTKTDDTNVTLTLGGSPSVALLAATSLTLGWTGTLATGRGGTGLSSIGTALQYLRVNSGATGLEYATFPTIPTVNPSALTKTDDTNVTLTLGGTPATSLLQAVSLTLGWTGQLSTSRGGTGLSTIGTSLQYLRVNSGGTALEYATFPSTSGLLHGTASGTNNYTVTISGVTGYADGDAYIIKFTNGNDADSDININGLGVKTLVKQFDVQLTGGDIVSGQELIIMYDGTNFQTLGVAPNQLFAYVTNDDSVTITKGQPVYAAGSAGNRMSVKLAYNTSDTTSAQTVGVVFSTSIAPNQRGFIITQGVISGVNTAAYSAGAQLYLGATAGTLTATKPYAPNHLVYVGIVERANAGNGQIYVKPQNGYELDEIHDVDLKSVGNIPSNNDILTYITGTNNLWKPRSIATILGYTPQAQLNGTGFVKASGTTISYDNSTYYLASNPSNFIPLTALSSTATGLTYTNTTGVFSLTSGYVIPTTSSATNWDTAYTNRITSLTTTGSSGASTLSSNTLNIPNYTLSGLGGVPTSRQLTINGTTYDLSADRSWTISAGISLTTTGTSGNATLVSTTLNIPNYGLNDLSQISVSTSNAREDNYAPTGWPGTSDRVKIIRIDSTNTNYMMSLGGLASPTAGRVVTIVNASAANNLIIIENLSTSSTAANRFRMTSNMAYFLLPTRSITFIYDGTYWTQLSASNPMGLDLFDDCTGGPQNYANGAVGITASISSGTNSGIRAEGDLFGSFGLSTGTTAAGGAAITTQARRAGANNAFALNSDYPYLVVGKLALMQTATVAQDFKVWFGINGDGPTVLNNTFNPIGYNWYYNGSSSSLWDNRSQNAGGTVSQVSSPLTAAVTSVVLGVYKPGGANIRDAVYFYSTDYIIYQVSTKFVGTTGNYGGNMVGQIYSTAGTTAKELRFDYHGASVNLVR